MDSFWHSFLLIFLAELGDKTQLLALAFATRFKPLKVIAGISMATLCLIGLAVGFGRCLTQCIPLSVIQFAAAVSFIVFGLMMLRPEKEEKAEAASGRLKLGPVLTVAFAFFIAEMGDKTQLATISLSVKYPHPWAVLLGATGGMVLVDTIGIAAGIFLKKHIPQDKVRWISAVVFILFGVLGLVDLLKGRL